MPLKVKKGPSKLAIMGIIGGIVAVAVATYFFSTDSYFGLPNDAFAAASRTFTLQGYKEIKNVAESEYSKNFMKAEELIPRRILDSYYAAKPANAKKAVRVVNTWQKDKNTPNFLGTGIGYTKISDRYTVMEYCNDETVPCPVDIMGNSRNAYVAREIDTKSDYAIGINQSAEPYFRILDHKKAGITLAECSKAGLQKLAPKMVIDGKTNWDGFWGPNGTKLYLYTPKDRGVYSLSNIGCAYVITPGKEDLWSWNNLLDKRTRPSTTSTDYWIQTGNVFVATINHKVGNDLLLEHVYFSDNPLVAQSFVNNYCKKRVTPDNYHCFKRGITWYGKTMSREGRTFYVFYFEQIKQVPITYGEVGGKVTASGGVYGITTSLHPEQVSSFDTTVWDADFVDAAGTTRGNSFSSQNVSWRASYLED
ncbi:hypothetical protein IT418_03960 [bacterium]|nr:hypothetical protein [bacterium]